MLRSSNWARSEDGLGIVIEALNFERRSPKNRSGAFGEYEKRMEKWGILKWAR